MIDVAAAIALIFVPLLFNGAFLALGRSFDYPDILRKPAGEVLERFAAGGSRLVLTWWVLLLAAVLFVPLAGLVGVVQRMGASEALAVVATAVGVAAGIVQAIGLSRWPFAVPELARRYASGDPEEQRDAVRQFDTLNRLLGVGIGEHLGYLLSGLWTLLVAASLIVGGGTLAILGVIGLPIGVGQIVGSFEFVGPFEPRGWRLAGILVPIAYLAWSVWLIGFGVVLLLSL